MLAGYRAHPSCPPSTWSQTRLLTTRSPPPSPQQQGCKFTIDDVEEARSPTATRFETLQTRVVWAWGNVSETAVFRCDSTCHEDANTWPTKCNYETHGCADCGECKDPYYMGEQNKFRCESWCWTTPQSWLTLCTHPSHSCSDCAPCKEPRMWTLGNRCEGWCGTDTNRTWDEKCDDPQNTCNDCGECKDERQMGMFRNSRCDAGCDELDKTWPQKVKSRAVRGGPRRATDRATDRET